jgi:hypothetical protein
MADMETAYEQLRSPARKGGEYVTFADAVESVREDITARWGTTGGTPAVSPNGYEDADDYLVNWGAREHIIDGDDAYVLLTGSVTFVNKRTGQIRQEMMVEQFDKVGRMVPISVG